MTFFYALATKIESSDATVIWAMQSLGFNGLPHLKTAIAEKLDKGVRTPVVGVTPSHLSGARPHPFRPCHRGLCPDARPAFQDFIAGAT